jgi:hypothetical protein
MGSDFWIEVHFAHQFEKPAAIVREHSELFLVRLNPALPLRVFPGYAKFAYGHVIPALPFFWLILPSDLTLVRGVINAATAQFRSRWIVRLSR